MSVLPAWTSICMADPPGTIGPPDPDAILEEARRLTLRPADVEEPEYEQDTIACTLTLDARQAYLLVSLCEDGDEWYAKAGGEDSIDAKALRHVHHRIKVAGAVDPDE